MQGWSSQQHAGVTPRPCETRPLRGSCVCVCFNVTHRVPVQTTSTVQPGPTVACTVTVGCFFSLRTERAVQHACIRAAGTYFVEIGHHTACSSCNPSPGCVWSNLWSHTFFTLRLPLYSIQVGVVLLRGDPPTTCYQAQYFRYTTLVVK